MIHSPATAGTATTPARASRPVALHGALDIGEPRADRDRDHQVHEGAVRLPPAPDHEVGQGHLVGLAVRQRRWPDRRLQQCRQLLIGEDVCAPEDPAEVRECARAIPLLAALPAESPDVTRQGRDLRGERGEVLAQLAKPPIRLLARLGEVLGEAEEVIREDDSPQLGTPLRPLLQEAQQVVKILDAEGHGLLRARPGAIQRIRDAPPIGLGGLDGHAGQFIVEDQFSYQRDALPRRVAEVFNFERTLSGLTEAVAKVVDELIEQGRLVVRGYHVYLA